MQELIVDTSAIIFAAENSVDVFASILDRMPGYAILVSKGVVNELERLSGSRTGKGRAAKLGLRILRAHAVTVLKDESYVDSWIGRESVRRKCEVCTNDRALKERLRRLNVRVVSVSPKGILR